MEIDFAIHSSDDNELYLEFWPIVSKIWKLKFNVEPILLYIGKDADKIDCTYGKVIAIEPIKGIPTSLQAQWSRFWYTQFSSNKISIITDIDMIPLSKEYFINQISNISSDKYVHINPCLESYGALPACYHIASGNNFKEILGLDESFEDSLCSLIAFDSNLPQDFSYHNNGLLWFADERFSTYKILHGNYMDKVMLIDRKEGQNSYRIDRSDWKYNINLLGYDYYYDCHSARPYSAHRNKIDEIVNISLSASSRKPNFLIKFFYELPDKLKQLVLHKRLTILKNLKKQIALRWWLK